MRAVGRSTNCRRPQTNPTRRKSMRTPRLQSYLCNLCPNSGSRRRQLRIGIRPNRHGSTQILRLCSDRPNITGQVTGYNDRGFLQNPSGAFYEVLSGKSGNSEGQRTATVTLGFSADKSSGTFGSAETVQPASLRILPCIKT